MLEDGRITWKQIAFLIIVSRLVIAITYLPALASPPGNQDTWLVKPPNLVITLLMVLPLYLLSKRFPDKTLIQYSEVLLGPAGKLVGILYVWYFIHVSAITLRQFGDFFTAAQMPETPLLVFIIALAVLAASAVRNGLEVIGRISEVICPLLMFTLALLAVLIAKDLDLKNLQPFFEQGYLSTVHGGFTTAMRNSEILLFAMAVPYLNRKEDLGKAIIVSISAFTFFFMLIDVTVIGLFGVEEAKMLTFPFFSLSKLINIGNFLERIEAMHMAIWILGTFLNLSLFYYLAVLSTAQLLRLTDYKPLVLPLGAIIVSLSILLFGSLVELREFTSWKIWTPYGFFFLVFLPYTLLITELIRKKGQKI